MDPSIITLLLITSTCGVNGFPPPSKETEYINEQSASGEIHEDIDLVWRTLSNIDKLTNIIPIFVPGTPYTRGQTVFHKTNKYPMYSSGEDNNGNKQRKKHSVGHAHGNGVPRTEYGDRFLANAVPSSKDCPREHVYSTLLRKCIKRHDTKDLGIVG